jgi:hypothetical protein
MVNLSRQVVPTAHLQPNMLHAMLLDNCFCMRLAAGQYVPHPVAVLLQPETQIISNPSQQVRTVAAGLPLHTTAG